jgi:hypothetical protein
MFDVASFMRLVVVRSSSSSPATVGAALSLSGVDAPTVGACDAKQVDACGRFRLHVRRAGNFWPDVLQSEPRYSHVAERTERDAVLLRGCSVGKCDSREAETFTEKLELLIGASGQTCSSNCARAVRRSGRWSSTRNSR